MTDVPKGVALARAAEVETLAGEPGAIRLLLDSSHTAGALSTQRVTLRDGADGATPHIHERSTELFFVLAGRAQILTGDIVMGLEEGDTLTIAPGVTHAFGAATGSDADLLIVLTPGVERFGYFRMLGGIMAGQLEPQSLLAEQERYDTYFRDSATWSAAR